MVSHKLLQGGKKGSAYHLVLTADIDGQSSTAQLERR